ncbi:hypothetical protein [Alkaliphilus transvaalensis]|uniref:hypothetical protein n=1 Tax=Alkaliphilus transvaalensis TaxID=114628 RepID=UPI00047D1637|nr:hypothetical protein [Alkaliphilus transvaalensis]
MKISIDKRSILIFIGVNLGYFVLMYFNHREAMFSPIAYIIIVGIFTEGLCRSTYSDIGYFKGVLIGAKYLAIVALYLGIRYLLGIIGINLPA